MTEQAPNSNGRKAPLPKLMILDGPGSAAAYGPGAKPGETQAQYDKRMLEEREARDRQTPGP